jgi:hypothetical protein
MRTSRYWRDATRRVANTAALVSGQSVNVQTTDLIAAISVSQSNCAETRYDTNSILIY